MKEARPVVCDEPLVEAGLVLAGDKTGGLIPLVNWKQNIRELNAPPNLRVTVTLDTALPQFGKVSLASCGALPMAKCLNAGGGRKLNVTEVGRSFSVDLAVADAIILRE